MKFERKKKEKIPSTKKPGENSTLNLVKKPHKQQQEANTFRLSVNTVIIVFKEF